MCLSQGSSYESHTGGLDSRRQQAPYATNKALVVREPHTTDWGLVRGGIVLEAMVISTLNAWFAEKPGLCHWPRLRLCPGLAMATK